jgi:hypothetical protein
VENATLSGVYVPAFVETAALDVLYRSGWRPVTRDAVTAWFDDRSRHAGACPCWRCTAASKANPDRVWRCLRDWRRTAAAPTASSCLLSLPEQARMLRAAGLTMREIGAELGCSAATVHRNLHSA